MDIRPANGSTPQPGTMASPAPPCDLARNGCQQKATMLCSCGLFYCDTHALVHLQHHQAGHHDGSAARFERVESIGYLAGLAHALNETQGDLHAIAAHAAAIEKAVHDPGFRLEDATAAIKRHRLRAHQRIAHARKMSGGEALLEQLQRIIPGTAWSCPDCGFLFDAAALSDETVGYACPVCELTRLRGRESVRVIGEMQNAVAERDRALVELDSARREAQRLAHENTRLAARVAQVESDLAQHMAEEKRLADALTAANAESARASTVADREAASLRAEVSRLVGRAEAADLEITRVAGERDYERKQHSETRGKLDAARLEITTGEETRRRMAADSDIVVKHRGEIARDLEAARATIENLEKDRAWAQGELDRTERQTKDMSAMLESLRSDLDAASKAREEADAHHQKEMAENEAARMGLCETVAHLEEQADRLEAELATSRATSERLILAHEKKIAEMTEAHTDEVVGLVNAKEKELDAAEEVRAAQEAKAIEGIAALDAALVVARDQGALQSERADAAEKLWEAETLRTEALAGAVKVGRDALVAVRDDIESSGLEVDALPDVISAIELIDGDEAAIAELAKARVDADEMKRAHDAEVERVTLEAKTAAEGQAAALAEANAKVEKLSGLLGDESRHVNRLVSRVGRAMTLLEEIKKATEWAKTIGLHTGISAQRVEEVLADLKADLVTITPTPASEEGPA